MKANFYGHFFKLCRWIVRLVYPKYNVRLPNLPDGPVVYVSHHQNLFGPFISLLWFPESLHAWILHVFLERKACFKQYVDYTFTKRFGWNRLLAKVCAYPIAFFITSLLNSGKGIPVFRGSRKILATFSKSIEALNLGESIVIFPDIDYSDSSSQIKDMYDGFLYIEKYYFKETGRHVGFVPLYVSKRRRLISAGLPIYFRENGDFNLDRRRVYEKIKVDLNRLAEQCGDI